MGFEAQFRFTATVKYFPTVQWLHYAYFDSDDKARKLAERLAKSGMFLSLNCWRRNPDDSEEFIWNKTIEASPTNRETL